MLYYRISFVSNYYLTVPKTECGMVDLCVVLDSSGSIKDRNPTDGSYDNWELILSFVKGVS